METSQKLKRNPEAKASFFSRLTYLYIVPLLWKGFRRQLTENDMCEPLPQHFSEFATKRLSDAWEEEKLLAAKNKRRASLASAVRRVYAAKIALYGIILFLESFAMLLQPLAMGRLIRYFRFDTPLTKNEALLAAAGVAITSALYSFLHHPYFYGLQKIGMELKIATSGLIMQKGIRLSSSALHKTTVGHMVNLLSTDIAKFDMSFIFLHHLWVTPLIFIGYIILLWQEMGVASIFGLITLGIFVPAQGYFSRQMGKCRRQIAIRTDKRISVMNEVLNGIRVIKMYSWEDAFMKVVDDLRKKELSKVRENSIWQSLVMGTFWSSGKVVILSAIICYLLLGYQITAERIFVATALFNACRLPITLFIPFALQFLFETFVSLRRIQNFLELEEYEYSKNLKEGEMNLLNGGAIASFDAKNSEKVALINSNQYDNKCADVDDGQVRVVMKNFSAVWDTDMLSEDPEKIVYAVKNINFTASPGELIGVVGPVGSGKSSLLFSILRETKCVSGQLDIKGSIAFASQDAWIFSGTVKENVIFGDLFDEKRYQNALQLSALNKDLSQLPNGDLSYVGDRGQSLSGGQRARISLARAIYRNADIYLLDDPLSAVDSAVGRYLYDKCVLGFLKNKITILVTHQVQYFQDVNQILLMQNGEMITCGTMDEVKKMSTFADIIQETEKSYSRMHSLTERLSGQSPVKQIFDVAELFEGIESIDEDIEKTIFLKKSLSQTSSKKIDEECVPLNDKNKEEKTDLEEEDRAVGSVSWRVYLHYLSAMADPLLLIPLLLLFSVFVQIFNNFIDWWLNKWTSASEKALEMSNISRTDNLNEMIKAVENNFTDSLRIGFLEYDVSLKSYRNIFAIMVFALLFFSIFRCIWFRMTQIIASRSLHNQMFAAVLRAKIIFFDKNPIGRILNRFSKDVGAIDEQLSFVFFEFFVGILNFLSTVTVIILINPFVFLPTLPLIVIFFFLRIFYLASSRDVKRLEATTRSPLYSHISAVMNGIITVRAFSSSSLVLNAYHNRQDLNSAAFYLTLATGRWFAFVIDLLVTMFITAVAFSSVLSPALNSSSVALSLLYAISMAGLFSRFLDMWTRCEINMVSVERLVNYSKIPSEPLQEGEIPPPNWPSAGRIEFRKVSLRYEETAEHVLEDICADIKPKEKIGIVGRTGAGKSSLLRALFRLTEPEGSILIDNLDTKQVKLRDLRKRISIIPQDPVLFIGSLRHNLDPFKDYNDEEIWKVLEEVEMKNMVSNLPMGLETPMHEGGANFSVGQRQLVCLARALIRHSKILVIDEATANVDPETDGFIQKTIKDRFKDSTVLTIAHRLNTIMDSDRVMVLESGRLIEFDHPYILLRRSQSVFGDLVAETGPANAKHLMKLSAIAYRKNLGKNESGAAGQFESAK